MGCQWSDVQQNSLATTNSLVTNTTKLKFALEQLKEKIRIEGMNNEKKLINQINQAKIFRNKNAEEFIMSQIVLCMNKISIIEIISQDCKRIVEYEHILQSKQNFHYIEKSFKRILFAADIISDECLNLFEKCVLSHYPSLKYRDSNQIQEVLLKHYKRNHEPSPQMIKEYAFRLVLMGQVTLEKLNQIGHNFSYKN